MNANEIEEELQAIKMAAVREKEVSLIRGKPLTAIYQIFCSFPG